MIQQELVEKRPYGKERVAYGITPKGTSILNIFKEFKQMLPVEENPNQLSPISLPYQI